MSDERNSSTRAARKGVVFPGNPKRWRNAKQAMAQKRRKRAAARRQWLRTFNPPGIRPLTIEDLRDLPPAVIAQLSREARQLAKGLLNV